MACKKSTITNTSSTSYGVISFEQCSNNLTINNYEIPPLVTIDIWYTEFTYRTASTNLTLSDTIDWPPTE